jgi:hypothetical protein
VDLYILCNLIFDTVLALLSGRLAHKTSTYDNLFPFILCFAVASAFLLSADFGALLKDDWTLLFRPSARVLGFKVIVMTGLVLSFFRPKKPSLTSGAVIAVMSELETNRNHFVQEEE